MQINPAEEWQRLIEHYRGMFDGELEDLASNMDDLTETAREVLRNEMKNRGLAMSGEKVEVDFRSRPASSRLAGSVDPDAENGPSDGATGSGEDEAPKDYTWKTTLCECETWEQARQIRAVLERAGIESWTDSRGASIGGYLRVVVGADQLKDAIQIASQPIPQEIIEESKIKVPEYVLPTCPKCGAEDPVLESAEPTNSWLCEACGAEWTEPETASDIHQG